MKHFDICQWTDFARGVVPGPDRTAMDAHLSSQGCVRCRATLALVLRVVAVARAEDRYTPPEDVVRCVKAIGAVRRPQGLGFPGMIARLVYDSFRDPVPAGIRAQDRTSRHALYEAENYCLDLQLQHDRGTPLVTLMGQLTNRQDPDTSVAEAPILLMARKDVIAHAVSNPFGEFQLEYAPTRHLRLCVPLDPSGKGIEVSLDRLAGDEPPEPRPERLRRLRGRSARRRRK